MGGRPQICNSVCQCGATVLESAGAVIADATCSCESCVTAGRQFERESGAPHVVRADGGVDYTLVRKDRVTLLRGREHLMEHRLTPESPTRRVVATCCNSPMFLDFAPGHWLSLYGCGLVDRATRPRLRAHTPRFFLKLLGSWAVMGFKRPKLSF